METVIEKHLKRIYKWTNSCLYTLDSQFYIQILKGLSFVTSPFLNYKIKTIYKSPRVMKAKNALCCCCQLFWQRFKTDKLQFFSRFDGHVLTCFKRHVIETRKLYKFNHTLQPIISANSEAYLDTHTLLGFIFESCFP